MFEKYKQTCIFFEENLRDLSKELKIQVKNSVENELRNRDDQSYDFLSEKLKKEMISKYTFFLKKEAEKIAKIHFLNFSELATLLQLFEERKKDAYGYDIYDLITELNINLVKTVRTFLEQVKKERIRKIFLAVKNKEHEALRKESTQEVEYAEHLLRKENEARKFYSRHSGKLVPWATFEIRINFVGGSHFICNYLEDTYLGPLFKLYTEFSHFFSKLVETCTFFVNDTPVFDFNFLPFCETGKFVGVMPVIKNRKIKVLNNTNYQLFFRNGLFQNICAPMFEKEKTIVCGHFYADLGSFNKAFNISQEKRYTYSELHLYLVPCKNVTKEFNNDFFVPVDKVHESIRLAVWEIKQLNVDKFEMEKKFKGIFISNVESFINTKSIYYNCLLQILAYIKYYGDSSVELLFWELLSLICYDEDTFYLKDIGTWPDQELFRQNSLKSFVYHKLSFLLYLCEKFGAFSSEMRPFGDSYRKSKFSSFIPKNSLFHTENILSFYQINGERKIFDSLRNMGDLNKEESEVKMEDLIEAEFERYLKKDPVKIKKSFDYIHENVFFSTNLPTETSKKLFATSLYFLETKKCKNLDELNKKRVRRK